MKQSYVTKQGFEINGENKSLAVQISVMAAGIDPKDIKYLLQSADVEYKRIFEKEHDLIGKEGAKHE